MVREIDPRLEVLMEQCFQYGRSTSKPLAGATFPLARQISARLAPDAANDLIQPLHESVMDAIGGIVRLDDSADEERLSDAVLDAVMAVIDPDRGICTHE